MNAFPLSAHVAVTGTIPWLEAGIMRQFGVSYAEAREIAQRKRRRAGKVRAARYTRRRVGKGERLR